MPAAQLSLCCCDFRFETFHEAALQVPSIAGKDHNNFGACKTEGRVLIFDQFCILGAGTKPLLEFRARPIQPLNGFSKT